jgi:hypothetical protein
MRELQAATGLAHLLSASGARDEAREVLGPVVSWFQKHGDPAAATFAIPLLDSCSAPEIVAS